MLKLMYGAVEKSFQHLLQQFLAPAGGGGGGGGRDHIKIIGVV